MVQPRCLCPWVLHILQYMRIIKDAQNFLAQAFALEPKPLILMHHSPTFFSTCEKPIFTLTLNLEKILFSHLKINLSKRKPKKRKILKKQPTLFHTWNTLLNSPLKHNALLL